MRLLAQEEADRRFAEHLVKMYQDKLEQVAESGDEKPDDDDDDEEEPRRKKNKKLSKKEKKG